jgi:hypothetical protein
MKRKKIYKDYKSKNDLNNIEKLKNYRKKINKD